jgi:hypothetical protein
MEHEHESDLGWCVLELMGHRQLAGQLRSVELVGASFLRIDIPGSEDRAPATQFYSPGAVYAITPTSEEVARRLASRIRFEPVSRFDLLPPAPSHIDE